MRQRKQRIPQDGVETKAVPVVAFADFGNPRRHSEAPPARLDPDEAANVEVYLVPQVTVLVDGRIEALDSPKNLKKEYKAKDMYDVFYTLARKAQRSDN